jgi:hypothetical protein
MYSGENLPMRAKESWNINFRISKGIQRSKQKFYTDFSLEQDRIKM